MTSFKILPELRCSDIAGMKSSLDWGRTRAYSKHKTK